MDREKGHDTANNFEPKTRVIVASGGKDIFYTVKDSTTCLFVKEIGSIIHMVLDSNENRLKSNLVLGNSMAKSIRQASKKIEAPAHLRSLDGVGLYS